MTVEFVPFERAHFAAIQATHPTDEMEPGSIVFAETALRDGWPIYVGGFSSIGERRLAAWGRLGDAKPRELALIARRMREAIDRRTAAGDVVTVCAAPTHRGWLKHLGYVNAREILVATR